MARKLTEKQQRFVEEYLIDLNATQAAIRAGFSPKTAEQQGSQLLKKTLVLESISRAMAARSKRTGISQDRVIMELAKIAFVNIDELINTDDASIKKTATADDLACIQSIKVKTTDTDKGKATEREIRLCDRMKALEMLGKHLGIWKDKLEVDGDMELNINIDYGSGGAD
jgi:phage terminase small subunit